MKRIFGRRANDKVDAIIDPYTFERDIGENDHIQEILMGHTNGPAFQDISIGSNSKRPLLRRNRMMSLESDFRISRVDLSPLTQENAIEQAQSEVTSIDQDTRQSIRLQKSNISFSHPYAAETESFRDISSAARAYLPNSTSLLTTTTSHARLYNGKMNSTTSSFQLNSKPSGELNSWPSSILMHPLNTLPQKANASSPIRRKVPPSDQISWRESLEQQLGLESEMSKQDTFDHLDHFSDHDTDVGGIFRSSTLAMHRKRSVPVLRGVSHANRQRQSMLISLAQDDPEVDEFGQLIKPAFIRQKPYSTTVIAKTGNSTQNEPDPTLFSSQRSTKPTKASNNRDTFGILIGGRKETPPDLASSLPRTPPQVAKIHAMACPPTLGLDTPALIGTHSTFGETPQKEIKRDLLRTSISSSRSAKSRLRINDAKEIVLQPSPHSSTFRFPALCIAAMDRAEAMAEALASPHYTDKAQLRNHSPSVSLASARFERPSAAFSEEHEEQDHAMLGLLGSPIKLTSEELTSKQTQLKSRFSSSSESSFEPLQSSDEEKMPKKTLMKEAKSDTYITMIDKSRKPRSLFESESMPIVKLEMSEKTPVTPPKLAVEAGKTDQEEEAKESQDEHASLTGTDTVPKSSLVVSHIIEQQEEVMQRLRRSSKWSPVNIKGLSPTFEAKSHSSWTFATSTDVELDIESDQEVQEPSSMDKCVDWECNAVSYDANTIVNPIVDIQRNPILLDGSKIQTKASSEESYVKKSRTTSRTNPYLVDKAIQTDACPPPRPVRNEARRTDSTKNQKVVNPAKPPDICILLASPRRGDDENPLDGLSFNVGLGIITNEEDPNEGTLDETLLTPRALEDQIHIPEESSTTLEVFEEEMDALIQTLSSTFTPIAKKYSGIPLSSVSEESSKEELNSPPLSSSTTTVTIFQAPRESTTTATIEAMIEQLRGAQRTPERLVLNKGGRRHENRAQND